MAYRNILLAHDGSTLADAATSAVQGIAAALDAQVLVLSVVESVADVLAYRGPSDNVIVDDIAELVSGSQHAEAKTYLRAVSAALNASGVRGVKIRVVEDNPGPSIVRIAEEERFDLIVMGSHGHSGFQRASLGSVADYVARHAVCHVLLCHPAGANKPRTD